MPPAVPVRGRVLVRVLAAAAAVERSGVAAVGRGGVVVFVEVDAGEGGLGEGSTGELAGLVLEMTAKTPRSSGDWLEVKGGRGGDAPEIPLGFLAGHGCFLGEALASLALHQLLDPGAKDVSFKAPR